MEVFAETRRWWPHYLVDEVMPEGQREPQDWLKPDENGVSTIFVDEEKTALGTIKPGETVGFLWHESRGGVDILVMPDGTWSLEDPRDAGTIDMFDGSDAAPIGKPPMAYVEAANWFAEWSDYETAAGSMDEFARNWAEMELQIPAEGERVGVVMGFWSDTVHFRVSADGKRLEPAEAAETTEEQEVTRG